MLSVDGMNAAIARCLYPVSASSYKVNFPYAVRMMSKRAGQTSLPSGLPTGTVDQSGSSVSAPFIFTLVGGLAAIAGLAYVLTSTAEIEK
jgi:hypothetical protein